MTNKKKSLYHDKEYYQRFYELIPDYKTFKEAWIQLEIERADLHGFPRYTSYIVFRSMKKRFLDKK